MSMNNKTTVTYHAHLAHSHGTHAQEHASNAGKAFAEEHGEKSHDDHGKK